MLVIIQNGGQKTTLDALVCVSVGAKQHIDKQDGSSIRNSQTTFININSKRNIDKKTF